MKDGEFLVPLLIKDLVATLCLRHIQKGASARFQQYHPYQNTMLLFGSGTAHGFCAQLRILYEQPHLHVAGEREVQFIAERTV
jgi:hypothetical protein